jgi:hypothetical protein
MDVGIGFGFGLSIEAICPCEGASVCVFLVSIRSYYLLTTDREISELSEFLRLMSGQWETASHCHISLSVLAAKINEAEDRGETTGNSQVYVRGVPGDDITLRDSLNAREERRRKLGDAHLQDDQSSSTDRSNIQKFDQKVQRQTGTDREHSLGREHDFTGVPSELGQPANLDDQGISAATPSSMQMNFQDIHPTYLEGISNFDLNMVDLIEGANIDSLFDMVGQQFPSF